MNSKRPVDWAMVVPHCTPAETAGPGQSGLKRTAWIPSFVRCGKRLTGAGDDMRTGGRGEVRRKTEMGLWGKRRRDGKQNG
jgi:hypothetical protein